jgi:hypothetical protein
MALMSLITSSMRCAGQRMHGRVGARQLGGRAFGGGARIVHLPGGIHHQGFDVARCGGYAGDVLGGLCRSVGSLGDLVRHFPVALHQLGRGAADARAGLGEGGDHLFDGVAEIAGEEQLPGMM